MSIPINYDSISSYNINIQNTCILNKNQNCAIQNVKDCKKTLKKCSWCKQKCLCHKINNKKFCKKYNYQNYLLKLMEHNPQLFYKQYFLPMILQHPNLSRYYLPPKNKISNAVYIKRYNDWLNYNKQFYSYWSQMYASQNSPSVYSMGATIVYGNN